MELFKPEDFNAISPYDNCREQISYVANKILNDYLETLPLVYSDHSDHWTNDHIKDDTHQARLIDIQECKPKECVHVGYLTNGDIILPTYPAQVPEPKYKCKYCKIDLEITWSAK